ncbi:MAG TPA: replication protein A [Methanosarcinaceae archaeon]|nr:replication protein A [Methanosarcinaceae archaeon]
MKETAKQIKDKFFELGVDIPIGDIEERLDKLVTKFKVPMDEARRSVINYFLKEHNMDRSDYFAGQGEQQPQGESPQMNTADILEADRWVSLRGKIVQLWDNTHESISQVGLIGDETGTIKFTKWQNAELPDVEEGKCYQFMNVMSKEWNGRINIDLNKNSSIEDLDEDIDIDVQGPSTESPQVNTADITEADRWVSLRGKIVQLWDNDHESISQVGLIGDESGTIKFTNWQSAELPDVEEGKCYLFSNVVSNEWNDKIQINLNKNSSIEEIDEDIEVGNSSVTFTGALVDIQSGSGLIKRCPECNRALTKGACTEHGKVEGLYDLRIKAIMDDGIVTQEALLNRELTEQVGEMTLDDAIAMAADALDQAVVLDLIKKKLVGKYYTVTGPKLDRYILVDSIEQESQVDIALVDDLLTEVEVA